MARFTIGYTPIPLLLLDTYSAYAAYSVRQLSSTATNCMRVRRLSDNLEVDIGFSGGWLDETAIINHCTGTTGRVVKLYDQSGNAHDAYNNTEAGQPNIYQSGAVNKYNNKPVLLSVGGSTNLTSDPFSSAQSQPCTYFVTCNTPQAGQAEYVFGSATATSEHRFYINEGSYYLLNGGSNWIVGTAPPSLAQQVHTCLFNTTSSVLRVNGSELGSGNNVGTKSMSEIRLMNFSVNTVDLVRFQELIMYNSDQTANFTAIESDINTAYTIY